MGKTRNSGLCHGTSGSPQGIIEQGNLTNKVSELARKQMIQPLIDANVKFNEKYVLFVTKDQSGQLVWLETGNDNGGLKHILDGNGKDKKGHVIDFEDKHGINRDEIANHIRDFISNGKIEYSILTIRKGREGYEKLFSMDGKYYLVSGIGTNGFVVSAYPIREKIAKALIRRNKK